MKNATYEESQTLSNYPLIDQVEDFTPVEISETYWDNISDVSDSSREEKIEIGYNSTTNQFIVMDKDTEDDQNIVNLKDESLATLNLIINQNFIFHLLSIRDSSIPVNYFSGDYDSQDLVINEVIIKNLMRLTLYRYGAYDRSIYVPWNNPIEAIDKWEEYIFSHQYYDTVVVEINLKDFLKLNYLFQSCFKDITMLLGIFELYLMMNGKSSFLLLLLTFIRDSLSLSEFCLKSKNPINTYDKEINIETLHGGFCALNRANIRLRIKKTIYKIHEFLNSNLFKKWSSKELILNDQEALILDSKISELKRFLVITLPNLRNLNQYLSDELIGITFPRKYGFSIVDSNSFPNLIDRIKENTKKSNGCLATIILEFKGNKLNEVVTKDFILYGDELGLQFIDNKLIVTYSNVCLFMIPRNKLIVIEGARYIFYPESKIACINNLLVTIDDYKDLVTPKQLEEILKAKDYNFVQQEDSNGVGFMII